MTVRSRSARAFLALALALALAAVGAFGAAPALAGPFPGCNATSIAAHDLSGCDLGKTVLSGADLSGKNLSRARLPMGLVDTDLSGADLSGVILTKAIMWRADLTGANLENAVLGGVDLLGANLSGTRLRGAIFSGYVSSGYIVGTPASLPNDGWRLVGGFLLGHGAIFRGANLSGVDLSGVDLSASHMRGGDDNRCPLLMGTGAGFGCPWVTVPSVDLSGANLSRANLSGAGLWGVNLSGTILTDSTILAGAVTGFVVGTPAQLPSGWKQVRSTLIGPGAILTEKDGNTVDLSGVDLRNLDISGMDFWGALVEGANVDGCDLASTIGFGYGGGKAQRVVGTPKTLPYRVSFVKGYLIGPKMFLPSALLEDADLSGLILTDANLAAAVLRGANLTGFDSGGDYVPTDDAASAQAAAKTPLAPGARMFRSILTNANITNAKLRYAGLAGVITGGLRGKPKYLPTGWMLAKGYLIGPKANLTGAKLNAVDFKTTNLAGTKLTGADLTGAKLSKAKLTGVISSGLVGKPASLPAGWKIDRSGRLYKS